MRGGVAVLALTVVVLAACGGPAVPEAAEAPHGYVEGAEETAGPQSRLVLADAGTGSVHVLDLITGRSAGVGVVEGLRGIDGDGRFAFLYTGTATHVVDSGAWTVDHGDHVHHYRARPRMVGAVAGDRPLAARSDVAVTAVSHADGTARLLDRARLEQGVIAETGKAALGAALPYQGHLLVASGGAVDVRGRGGEQVARLAEPCPRARGQAVTRRGAVLGCADGALLVTRDGAAFRGEKIGYPGTAEPATEFGHRPGSATLAARAGAKGSWLLDVQRRKWTLLDTGPAVAVTSAGAGAPVLALTADGVLHAFDPGTGERLARTRLLAGPVPGGTPAIQVDAARAYVNDPAAGAVHEIDYRDGLRRARTFELGFAPTHMVETGR